MDKEAKEKAQKGLSLIKEAIIETVEQNPDGIGNSKIAQILDIESDYEGKQRNYLSWSILGLLVNDKKVQYKKDGKKVSYFIGRK